MVVAMQECMAIAMQMYTAVAIHVHGDSHAYVH